MLYRIIKNNPNDEVKLITPINGSIDLKNLESTFLRYKLTKYLLIIKDNNPAPMK